MAEVDRVVLDTSALYALISSSDEFHAQAEAVYRGVLDSDTELWTTSYVLVEFTALVHRRLGFPALQAFVNSTQGVYETLWIDEAMHGEAWTALRQREGKGLNFVDWTTLLAARSLEATVFTFDSGFRVEGASVTP